MLRDVDELEVLVIVHYNIHGCEWRQIHLRGKIMCSSFRDLQETASHHPASLLDSDLPAHFGYFGFAKGGSEVT